MSLLALWLVGSVSIVARARAEALGIDAKVGLLQRPERVVLLAVPQAFFGLALAGLVLSAIITLLAVTAWITAAQRIAFVHRVTRAAEAAEHRGDVPGARPDPIAARGPI